MRQLLHRKILLSTGEYAEVKFIYENEPHQPLVKVNNDHYYDLRKHTQIKIIELATR